MARPKCPPKIEEESVFLTNLLHYVDTAVEFLGGEESYAGQLDVIAGVKKLVGDRLEVYVAWKKALDEEAERRRKNLEGVSIYNLGEEFAGYPVSKPPA
jgi:hypothetical protein